MWGASETLTQGLLATGPSTGVAGEYFLAPGGSGRLGRLVVGPGETRTLGTNGVLLSTIGGIAVAAVDSPFVALSSDGGGGVIETPVPAVGRVV
jgi:hypothetical protein